MRQLRVTAFGQPAESTLLDLVFGLAGQLTDEEEIVAVAAALVRSGCVRLAGTFRGVAIDRLFENLAA